MFGEEVRFLASIVRNRKPRFESQQAKISFSDDGAARKGLYRLEREGLIFPLARGTYAAPSPERYILAQEMATPSDRLAAWLPQWLDKQAKKHDDDLARGLGWKRASFFGLAVHMWTQLEWRGPLLFVPIEDHAIEVGKLHHRVPIFAGDPVFPTETVNPVVGEAVPVPSPLELARILSVQSDPRLVNAARELVEREPKSEREKFMRARKKTDAPLPFPDNEGALPRGPPFRFRLYAPRSLVMENLRKPVKRDMDVMEGA